LNSWKRNLRITNQETKSAAYFSLVRPNLEYCASIWNPHHKQSIQKLEMTQRRAARYTTNIYTTTSSVNEMLQQLKWETLESRRTKIQLTMFYKIVNNLMDIPADHYLTPSKTRTRTTHSKKMLQYHTLKFSFFPQNYTYLEYATSNRCWDPRLGILQAGVGFSSVLNLTGLKLLVSSK
jgi:hypothetical protein